MEQYRFDSYNFLENRNYMGNVYNNYLQGYNSYIPGYNFAEIQKQQEAAKKKREKLEKILEKPVEKITDAEWNIVVKDYLEAVETQDVSMLNCMLKSLAKTDVGEAKGHPQVNSITLYEYTISAGFDIEKCNKMLSKLDKYKQAEEYNLLFNISIYNFQKTYKEEVSKEAKDLAIVPNAEVIDGTLHVKLETQYGNKTIDSKEYTRLNLNTNYSASLLQKICEMGETKDSFTNMLLKAINQTDADVLMELYNEDYEKVFSHNYGNLSVVGQSYIGKYGNEVFYSVNGEKKLQNFINEMLYLSKNKCATAESNYHYEEYIACIVEYAETEMKIANIDMVDTIFNFTGAKLKGKSPFEMVKGTIQKTLENTGLDNTLSEASKYSLWSSDAQLVKMKNEMQKKGEMCGLWNALLKGVQSYAYDFNEVLLGLEHFEIGEVSREGDLIAFSLYSVGSNESLIKAQGKEYKGHNIRAGMIWDDNAVSDISTTVEMREAYEQEQRDKLQQSYYIALIAGEFINPVVASVVGLAVDAATQDVYYGIRDTGSFIKDHSKYNNADKIAKILSHTWKIYNYDIGDRQKKIAEGNFIESLGSAVYAEVGGQKYIVERGIYNPYILDTIRILQEQGIGIFMSNSDFDSNVIIKNIGYKEEPTQKKLPQEEDLHQLYKNAIMDDDSIKDKKREFEKREEYYDALLEGSGEESILEMEPDVLYRCVVDINCQIEGSFFGCIKDYAREHEKLCMK